MSERKMRWIVRGGVLLLRALATTWRFRFHGDDLVRSVRKEHRVIFTLWHGELLPLLWAHRQQRIAIVISQHNDGEIIARVAHALELHTVRGSTSRGGSRALIGLIRAIGEGFDGAITPDGPRGPARVFAPGVAVAAQRSGALMLPLRAKPSRAWRLRSWDSFMIPMPFARVDVYYGVPTPVIADSPRAAAEQGPALQAMLDALPGG